MTRTMKTCGAAAVLACVTPALSVRANAPPGRYTASNGTVTDTKTKLIWQQASPSAMPWAEAKSYCAGIGATLGGNGWRLPTIKELQTLVDVSVSSPPAIDVTYFPNASSDNFWSSTPSTADSSRVWIVAFGDGSHAVTSRLGNNRARCVR